MIIIGLIIGITDSVFGATMCVKNDTISVALDPSINGTNYSYSAANSTWWTWFTYGTVRGISACLSSKQGKSLGGAYTAGVLMDYDPDVEGATAADAVPVVGGEKNGLHCWCKMTHPAASLWVFRYSYSSRSDCESNCAYNCGYNVRYYADMRRGLFGSVRN